MSPALAESVARLGMALLHFVWQGALIGCLAAAGLALLRNARPQARYALCGAALLLCLLLPLWQVLAHRASSAVAVAMPIHVVLSGPLATPARAEALSWAALRPGLPAVVLLWSLGAALMSLRLALGFAWVRRLRVAAGAAVYPIDPAWTARLAALAGRMGLKKPPRLQALEGVVEGLEGPITVGWWRPLILLPASLFTRMPADMLEALLVHELAHVRRLDYAANFVQSVVEVLLFYHPVVWWLSRRLRIEREQIADDLAADVLGEPRRLALALSELARWHPSGPSPATIALAAQGGSLMTRISRLVRPIRQPLGGKLLLPMAGLAGLAALAMAAQAAGLTAAAPAPAAQPTKAAPAAPAVPATPATKATTQTITVGDAGQAFAFAIVSGGDGSTTMSGNDRDMREIRARRASLSGEFLWVRQGAQRYVVTDPAALAEVHALWAPVHAFDAEMDKLGQQVDAQAEVVERVAREMQAAQEAPSAELEALGRRMEALQKQRDKAQAEVDKLSRRMAATRDEKKLEQLEQQQERLEKALEPIDASIDALSEQMDRIGEDRDHVLEQQFSKQEEDADKAMEALGRQMEALGQQQEAAAKSAEERLRTLVQDLVRRGLATKS